MMQRKMIGTITRRAVLQLTAAAAPALLGLGSLSTVQAQSRSQPPRVPQTVGPFPGLEEATIAGLQAAMQAGKLTARGLLEEYLSRIEAIDTRGPKLNSIIELNPDARTIADTLDAERARSGPRGPLHGIPILLKDNIDTADATRTAAGSLALVDSQVDQDATVAANLRKAGAIVLGKSGLSEWANFRSTRSSSGWSGRGRQVRHPYVLDHNPCGSSSGSAAAVSANLVAAALGTETDGSIVCPGSVCGVVGIKPTVGLTSRAGVVPISHTQDTVGPFGRTLADAAAVLGALTGVDSRDDATTSSAGKSFSDYTQFLDAGALHGAHIGVVRQFRAGISEHVDAVFDAAVEQLRAGGAVTQDTEIPGEEDIRNPAKLEGAKGDTSETIVLQYDFKTDIKTYLGTRPDALTRDLADLIQFNLDHADEEMPYFGQERFVQSQARGLLTDELYLKALQLNQTFALGFAQFMITSGFDALVAPTRGPSWPTDLINGDHGLVSSSQPAAVAGFPLITVPAGYAFDELPVGICFMGPAWSEPTLIRLAYAFEQANPVRKPPRFLPTLNLP
jgi:amidase